MVSKPQPTPVLRPWPRPQCECGSGDRSQRFWSRAFREMEFGGQRQGAQQGIWFKEQGGAETQPAAESPPIRAPSALFREKSPEESGWWVGRLRTAEQTIIGRLLL